MANLFDLMAPEDQQKVKAWAKERRESKYKRDIPPELYVAGQLGYYYGWEAVVDFRRGYHIGITDNGTLKKLAFSFEDAVAFVKAAEKVHYRQMVDSGRVDAATATSSTDKTYCKKNAEYVNKLAEKAYQ